MITNVRLVKQPDGSYQTPDGRFTVTPIIMGSGVTGWAGGRGWSEGHRHWRVTDTTGQTRIGDRGASTATRQRLYEARDLIAYLTR